DIDLTPSGNEQRDALRGRREPAVSDDCSVRRFGEGTSETAGHAMRDRPLEPEQFGYRRGKRLLGQVAEREPVARGRRRKDGVMGILGNKFAAVTEADELGHDARLALRVENVS